MTLSFLLPLILAAVAIIDLVAFRMMLARGKISERMFNLLALVSLALPLIAYVLLTVFIPDVGAIEIF